MNTSDVRVLIADDHPPFRAGLQALLSTTEGVEVVGEAPDGDSCVHAAAQLQPDVVLMDLHMPGLDGIQATRQIVERLSDVTVVALTMLEDDASVFAAIRAGARGYLLKGADRDDIVRAIHAAARGDVLFGSAIAERVISYFRGVRRFAATKAFPQLTDRELELLALIANGRNNADIARELFISEKTVRNHVSNIFAKLHVADRAQAIIKARDAGIGDAT
ncbi:MAG: response regulator transcription factor [Actinomycetota bacterium]|nr:response regulator transcription factor [Actinomycetota bacterium]